MFHKFLPPLLVPIIFIGLLGACQIRPVANQTPADLNELGMTETVVDSGILSTDAFYQTPTQAIEPKLPTATITISPTPTPTKTIPLNPEEQLQEYLKTNEAKERIDEFVYAMLKAGIKLTKEQVKGELHLIDKKADKTPLVDKDGNPFMVAAYNLDPDPAKTGETLEGPVALAIALKDKEGSWILKNVPLGINLKPVGTTVDFSDPHARSTQYQKSVEEKFDFITLTGAFMEEWWKLGGASYWTKWASSRRIPFSINNLFFHYDKIPPNLSAKEFIDQRLNRVITTITSNNKQSVPFEFVLAGEPYYEYQGKIFWQGEFNSQPYLLYRELGKNWIVEAEVELINKSIKSNLTLGVEFNIIGINLPGIEKPGNMSNYTINEIKKIKKTVFNQLDPQVKIQLGITEWKDIPFDVGMEFHLGKKLGDRNVTLPIEQFNITKINEHIDNIFFQTGSRCYATEVDGIGDHIQIAQAVSQLITKGKLESISFFEPYKPVINPNNDPWQNILFDLNQQPTPAYYLIQINALKTLLE